MTASADQSRADRVRPLIALACAAVLAWFLMAVAQFYLPGKGFTALIEFGSEFEASRLAAVKTADYYIEPDSNGYDGQFYAQIAVSPSLRDPGLAQSVDTLAYRARRILPAWAAWTLGAGHPAWVLEAYALLNVAVWLALAVLLWRWLPPVSWQNFFRWAGVLLCAGMCASVRSALTDGPALLLIIVAVGLVERGRKNHAAVWFALGGLCKETSVLAMPALWTPGDGSAGRWRRLIWRGVVVVAPLLLWIGYIRWRAGAADAAGGRNFTPPFVGLAEKWTEIWSEMGSDPKWLWSLAGVVSLSVQLAYLALRRDWDRPWWRVGASFAVLMIFLGPAVWEGDPGAALRVLLPMQVAFNVLLPTGRRWLPWLLLGNASLIAAPGILLTPPRPDYLITGPAAVTRVADGAAAVRLEFPAPWFGPENGNWYHIRRWSGGTAAVDVLNRQPRPLTVELSFGVSSTETRRLSILQDGKLRWSGEIGRRRQSVRLPLVLPPGKGSLVFATDRPPQPAGRGDPRKLAFCIYDLVVRVGVPPAD